MSKNRIPGLVKPRTFAKRQGIPWEYLKAIIHFRRINGLNESGAMEVLERGDQEEKMNMSLFVREEEFKKWLAATDPTKVVMRKQ